MFNSTSAKNLQRWQSISAKLQSRCDIHTSIKMGVLFRLSEQFFLSLKAHRHSVNFKNVCHKYKKIILSKNSAHKPCTLINTDKFLTYNKNNLRMKEKKSPSREILSESRATVPLFSNSLNSVLKVYRTQCLCKSA